MTLTADLQSIADVDPDVIAFAIEERDVSDLDDRGMDRGRIGGGVRRVAQRIVPDGSVLSSGLAMSAACIGSIMVASTLHRGSPWAGLNAVTSGLGIVGRRPPTRFNARLTAISVGTIVGGSLVVAALANLLTPARGIGRIGGGLLAAGGSYAMDRFLMRKTLLPALTSSLGPIGTVLKYGMIGVGAMLGRRTR
jgi:hypothetical protein